MTWPIKYTETIIPAHPGYTVIYIDIRSDKVVDDDPRMREPVIAWAVTSSPERLQDVSSDTAVCWAVPITICGAATAGNWALHRPDDMYELPNVGTFRTLAEAAKEIRETFTPVTEEQAHG